MSQKADPSAAARAAVAMAHEVAPDLTSVLLTHYPDADTLDTLRPDGDDLATVVAVNRAVALAMIEEGVEVYVQKADRAAFRRWMDGRADTPATRRQWIDRSGLLYGAEAWKLLGLPPLREAAKPNFAAAPGPVANRLIDAYESEDESRFDHMAQALLEAGRGDVLTLAVRKLAERDGEEAGGELEGALLAVAEGGRFGPSGWADLVALPVALPTSDVPDAAALGGSFVAAGLLPAGAEVRFLPGWRSPDALAALDPLALRRVLLDLVAGREPAGLPPGDTDDLAAQGFGVLLGLRLDWQIPVWEEIAATGMPAAPEEDDEESPEEARLAALFDAWRTASYDTHGGCVPLGLVPPSEAALEIADFLDEAAQHTDAIDDIRDFIAMARREAGGPEVVCVPTISGEALELTVYTEAGRFMDSLTLPRERMPAPAEEMVTLIGSFVRVVKDAPGQ